MVVINFEEQIQPGSFEYALHHLISDRLGLTPFDDLYCNAGKTGGRPAYDPAILLKISLFAYFKGITSVTAPLTPSTLASGNASIASRLSACAGE